MREFRGRIKSWTDANNALGDKDSRVIDNNTKLVRDAEDNIHVQFHNTSVVSYYKCTEDVIIRNGGWDTMSTYRRIEDYSFVNLNRKDWTWYVNVKGEGFESPIDYVDGMNIGGLL